jgi:hypothetical protein
MSAELQSKTSEQTETQSQHRSIANRLPPNVVFLLKNQHLRLKSRYMPLEKNEKDFTSLTKKKKKFSQQYLQHLLIPEAEEGNPDAQPVCILLRLQLKIQQFIVLLIEKKKKKKATSKQKKLKRKKINVWI